MERFENILNVSVTRLESRLDGLGDLSGLGLPSTQADRGDLLAVVESEVGSRSHFVFVCSRSG